MKNGNVVEAGATALAQDIIKSGYVYGADSVGTDAYAVALPVAPSAYADGLIIRFKAGIGNTGACTLNVNTLGAIAIKRPDQTDTITGDILANQIVEVTYRDGNFYMISPLPTLHFSHGVDTRAVDAASGTQNIAHGLGKIPKFVRISAWVKKNQGGDSMAHSLGVYDGVTTSCIYDDAYLGSSTTGSSGQDTTNGIVINGEQVAVITLDATNIILTWTRGGTSSGTNINIIWEAEV